MKYFSNQHKQLLTVACNCGTILVLLNFVPIWSAYNMNTRFFPQSQRASKQQAQELAELFTAVQDADLERQTAQREKLQSVIAALDEIAEDDCELHPLLNQTCDKTGAPVLTIGWDEYAKMRSIVGRDKLHLSLRKQAETRVHAMWVATDPQALDQLQTHDPLGYFVYAASLVLAPYQAAYTPNTSAAQSNTDARWQLHLDKAELYSNLQEWQLGAIMRCNESMRRYLSVFQTCKIKRQARFSQTCLGELDLAIFHSELTDTLKAAILQLQKQGQLGRNISYGDVVELQTHTLGYKQFLQQQKPRRMSDIDKLRETIMEVAPAFGLSDWMPNLTAPIATTQLRKQEQEHKGTTLQLKLPTAQPAKKKTLAELLAASKRK